MARVLIVDDQALYRAVVRTVVGLVPGWTVVAEAATGEDAVTEVARQQIDVVLMDINMPGMDGLDATRRITSTPDAPRVVLMSTYQVSDLPADPLESGAIAYLNKEDLTPARLSEALASPTG